MAEEQNQMSNKTPDVWTQNDRQAVTGEAIRIPRRTEPQLVMLRVDLYEDKNPERNAELVHCRTVNQQRFDVVVGFRRRSTYREMMTDPAPTAGITVIANADMEFPVETIEALRWLDLGNVAFALTRWNPEPDGTLKLQHPHPRGSQDCWIFQGPPKDVRADFTMGRPGCDNRFAKELDLAGYDVRNPSLTLKTIHRHTSEVRNYTRADVVERPYLLVEPCELEVVP